MRIFRGVVLLWICVELTFGADFRGVLGDTENPSKSAASILEWIKNGGKRRKPQSRSAWTDAQRIARDAYEVIEHKCFECHGAKTRQAGLDLRTVSSILAGGDSGPAAVKGDANASRIVQRVRDDAMPPRGLRYKLSIKPVTESEVAALRRWIDGGLVPPPPLPKDVDPGKEILVSAKDRKWWSFQPPRRIAVPEWTNDTRIRTPVDAFLLRDLRAGGLTFSPDADRRTLVRRLYLYVVGLPPKPSQVDSFINDDSPEAYTRLVDHLLASPGFGEHWGRYWLDAAGYADSEGALSSDPVNKEFYRYRDYVVRSMNSDKPYDRFLVEQLAGDELVNLDGAVRITSEMRDNFIATGFLRCGVDATRSPETNFLVDRHKVIVNTIDNLGSALLAMTLQCAQCHNHKYDPIPQLDYYRFGAIFAAAYSPRDWLKPSERYVPLATQSGVAAAAEHNAEVDRDLEPFQTQLAMLHAEFRERLIEEALVRVPQALVAEVREAVEATKEERTVRQADLVAEYGLSYLGRQVRENAEFQEAAKPIEAAKRAVESRRWRIDRAFGLRDMGSEVLPYHLLRRGNPLRRVHEVRPDVPSVLKPVGASGSLTPRLRVRSPWLGASTTGRRLALARWLTRPDHPLTARVIVNRIWRRYFGVGIVSTLDNFGNTGALPTHPELLDWLAVELVESGWSLKRVHRLLLLSTAFRQASRTTEHGLKSDPENKLLWRMPLQRLDAEPIRDSILHANGLLDRRMYGEPGTIDRQADGQVYTKPPATNFRRSVYMLRRRTQPLTMLETFDAPPPRRSCTERRTSIVVSQALLLENSQFMAEMAKLLAGRIEGEVGVTSELRVEILYRWVLSRSPTADERQLALEFLKAQASEYSSSGSDLAHYESLVDLCLTVLNTAEFVYVD